MKWAESALLPQIEANLTKKTSYLIRITTTYALGELIKSTTQTPLIQKCLKLLLGVINTDIVPNLRFVALKCLISVSHKLETMPAELAETTK